MKRDAIDRAIDQDEHYHGGFLLMEWTKTHPVYHPFDRTRQQQFWDSRLLSPGCEDIIRSSPSLESHDGTNR